MSSSEAWTVGRLLSWTADYLKKEGSSSPRLDAEVLLAHARNCSRVQLYTAFEEIPDDEQRGVFRDMVKRRAQGTPVAYLVGYKEFYSARFEVTPDVLIPRPETEHLVLTALDCAKQMRTEQLDMLFRQPPTQPVSEAPEVAAERVQEGSVDASLPNSEVPPLKIADVCTGSGIIAITMAKHLPSCHLTAIDISPAALEVARRNVIAHELTDKTIRLVCGDLLSNCPVDASFDLILSNPPYVSEDEYDHLQTSVRKFEPKLALVAGPTGGEIIERLIGEAVTRLRSGGYLIFEFSPMLEERLATWVGPEWLEPNLIKDLAGHSRIVSLQKK